MIQKAKSILKRILIPFLGPVLKVLHIKLFGRQIFINKYTLKIPFFDRTLKYIQLRLLGSRTGEERRVEYERWYKKNKMTKDVLAQQKRDITSLKKHPLISLIVPTYNTNPEHLIECIKSVLNQTYSNWELCIADDASTNERVRSIIKDYAAKDNRIKYVFRPTNGHICTASNSAIKLATGKYISLLDHDDILWPNALYEVTKLINKKPSAKLIYSDEDKISEDSKEHSEPFFKPGWSPEYLRSVNYITHFATLDRRLVEKIGGFRKGYEGAQDWDLFLRVSQSTEDIYHIPKVLYSWRKSENSTAQRPEAKNYAYDNQKKALEDDVKKRGLKADIEWEIPYSMWRVNYKLNTTPLVSIIIPTKNQYQIVKQCLESIQGKSTYKNYEVIIVDTGSTDDLVWDLYKDYDRQKNYRVIKWTKEFNFSAVCNFGASKANGEYFLFLNNDTEVISPDWIENMLGYASQKSIGAVGAKLYYPDGKLQHGGIILGVGGQNGTPGIAGHFFPAFRDNPPQDPAQQLYVGGARNFTAVTAACVMIAKDRFNKVKGFDAKFRIAFNDVDFCLKLLKAGYRNVYLPQVQLYHHESISIGKPGSKQRDLTEFSKEINIMLKKWKPLIENDPYYHLAFRRDVASARLRTGYKKHPR